ncbi:putative transcriptional regulator [Mycolicibacterium chubuense NBB4]|uniref:Putative transcriptional regulator n=1 Tax=Mycolicibacterium chubuense (strain NBB4) TaxID=710421 RepID=I4BNA1_MYCCN|nr:metalloregulator ArsR/SmtB family transcription factor [Mycolicibacterium chubuense]AFM18758.1 putative transcriptional regulator [Mycolicibacterium chubuense NBB4]
MSKSALTLRDATECAYAPMVREPLSIEAAAEIAGKLKALADPVRLRLFSLVASHVGGEACVCDISAGLDVKQPTISHHLKVLKEAGLLASERRSSWVYYSVVPSTLRTLAAVLDVADDGALA